ncbi:MAG: hypothetical protein IJW29_09665 [Clostridia bacterium]|nr:hypothetical protein [Clostridia bacterium]
MFQPSTATLELLDALERAIDPAVEEDFKNQWRDFWNGRFEGEIFTPVRKVCPTVDLPDRININDAIGDYDLMLRSQLREALWAISQKSRIPSVRANYGTGILSSVFGAEIFVMPYKNDTLPTTRSVNDTEWMRGMLERGMPDLSVGFGRQVLEMGEIYAEVFSKYPKIAKHVPVYHPDLQGPLDIAELLWGGEMFYAMYDEEDLVHGVLSLITDTYTAFMEKWNALHAPDAEMNTHWGSFFHRGTLVLRNDSAMNLSPDFYEEFSVPYDTRLLSHFGGGVMHFCGRGDHYIESLCKIPGLYGINMSQPHYNDMEKIYQNTVDRGIAILGFSGERAREDAGREGGYRHLLHS